MANKEQGYTLREKTQATRSEGSVDLFVTKLGHRLPEIRERAADSLLSAISLGLLPAQQLVARLRSQVLLPGWAGRQQALQLLDQITTSIPGDGQHATPEREYSPARRVGGEHSPVRRVGGEHSPVRRVGGEHSPGMTGSVGRQPSPVRGAPSQASPGHGDHSEQVGDGPDLGCSGDFVPVVFTADRDSTMLDVRMFRSPDSSDGEQDNDSEPVDTDQALEPPHEPDIIHSLPWKSLVESDLHVLTSTATSLTSGDGRAVRQALQFLNDVTLRDFPAEVFLQRPALLQAVFHVLVSTEESETDVILSCLECLASLTEALLQRCEVLSAPDTRQPATLAAGPSPVEVAGALPLSTFCGQLLSQAISCLYVRHWAVLVAAARLGAAGCRLARRTVPARLWTRPSGEAEEQAQQALMKALKVFDEVLRWHHKCCQSGDSVHLHRAGWLLAAGLLADAWAALRPPAGSWARRHRLLAAPLHALLDELLFAQQPALHARLLRLVTDAGCARLWRRLQRLRGAMKAARRLADGGGRADALAAAAAIELHGGRDLVERAVAAVCDAGSVGVTPAETADRRERTNKKEKEETKDADDDAGCRFLLRLLSSRLPAVRTAAYRRSAAAARAALRDTGRRTVPVLLQPAVLELALTDGLTDRHTESDATDLVLYAVTSEAWVPRLRPVLITALPLFLCHVTRPQLTRPLNHVIGLCRAEHLRSDLILTTHRSRAVRQDAWGRLVARLSAQNTTAELLPDLSQLGDFDLAELTLVDEPPLVTSRRGEVNDVLTLTALLPLAWCASAALDVRRATLSQLAVLLQDPDLHRAFLDHDGLPRLLSSVTRAVLREPDLAHDVSLVPDCVTVLRHLALFSDGCRHHLGDDPQLLLLLVRVLLMFRLDGRVRAAAAQLLLAASLDTALMCRRRPGAHTWDVLVPEAMCEALRLPFVATPRRRRPLGRVADELPASVLTEPVTVAGERVSVTGLLRSAWSLAWHGELQRPPVGVEYSEELLMPEWQLVAAAAGRLEQTAAETLRHLEGVSSHTAARVLLSQLGCYVTLQRQLADTDSEGVFSASVVDRWLSVLRRHLLTPPSTEPDRRVLAATLRLLLLLPPLDAPLPDRAISLLSEHSRVFTDTLVRAAGHHQPGEQQTALRALQLLAELCCRPVPGAASLLDALTSQAMAAAARAGSEHFYSLVSVQRCAALLQTALLSPHPLPESLLPAVRLLRDFSAAFLPAAGRTDSCMGAGVLAAAALCLPAVTERRENWTEEWTSAWSADVPDGGRLLWLAALWHHHQTQVRWGGLAAALGLTRWPEGAALVTHQLRHLPGGCWGAALGLLLDAGEAAAVREQAALLLASLTSHLLADEDGRLGGPEVANTDAEVCLTGPEALVTLLEHADWSGQLTRLVAQLQTGAASEPEQTVTPGLVAAVLRFTHNVAVMSPVDVVGGLTDTVHTLVQCSDALGVSGRWRDWPPAEMAPCWTEAVRLCSALVLLEQPGRPGAAHLLLCDRRLLEAAAGTAVATGDTELCEGLFSLLLALLSVDRDAAFSASAELLHSWPELWPALASAPSLLQPLLATEASRMLRLRPGPPQLAGLEAAGDQLCAALLSRGAAGREPLAALLLVSPAAKRAALQSQLHRQLTGQLRERIAALVTGSLSVKAARSKVKERTLLSDLVADLDLLRNLMSGSAEVKQALASDGLPNLLHKLWPWCVASRRLTVTVLCTLNTLAAGCIDGARGLAYTSAALHQAPSGSPSGASLVHVVLDDCQRHLERRSADGGAVQRLAVSFSLLAAASLVQEGRSIICRSSFLSGFRFWRGDSGSAAASEQKRRLAVTRLWMLLIKNVTFFDEGQKVVTRIPEVTGSLVALMSQEDVSLRSSAVLVLRNLSYQTPMQTALINTDGFVDGVTAALGSGQPAASCAAAALCLHLLTHSRKAKTVLTSSAHLEKLKSAADSLDVAADEQSSEVLSQVRELLKQESSTLAGQLAPTN